MSRPSAAAGAQRAPWRRRFPPTREGWWFLGATLLVGAAAVNAGLNLLFLVFGMMLFFILASGVMSEQCLRGTVVARRLPAAIHAGVPFLVGISVRNDKRRLPTFSLEVEDLIAGKPVERRCYFLKIPAGRQQETAYRHTVAQRGLHQLSGFRLSTRFPFGIIRKSRDVYDPAELLVYPALAPVSHGLLPAALLHLATDSTPRLARSGEFHGLREFRAGDDPRRVHWRTSARRGRLVLRESEEATGREIFVALGVGDPAHPDAFERAVSLAASLAVQLVRQGFRVGLITPGETVTPGLGPAHTHRLLRRLALVPPGGSETDWPRGASVVRVTPGAATPSIDRPQAAGIDRPQAPGRSST